ncbi:MAG: glutamine synthetase, partial [bacterium]|nr:glutamine synthetase [bacterium]
VHIYVGGDGFSDFWDAGYETNFSGLGRHFLGGILNHGRSVAAFSNPSTNSYKRFISGYEAPVSLFYSVGNRAACVRIPKYAINEREMRFEFRPGDATANPYLMFAAITMAGLDGIEEETEPGEPIDKNITDLSKRERKRIKMLPKSLDEALFALENDSNYLLRENIFDQTLIQNWITIKRKNEIECLQYRPHPYEYNMYFDL